MKVKRISIACILIAVCTCQVGVSSEVFLKSAAKLGSEKYVQDEIIVKFKDNVSAQKMDQINIKHNTAIKSASRFSDFKIVKVPQGKTPQQLVDDYNK